MMEDITHAHNYCNVAYKDAVAVIVERGIASESK
jgi:hypothetical protein